MSPMTSNITSLHSAGLKQRLRNTPPALLSHGTAATFSAPNGLEYKLKKPTSTSSPSSGPTGLKLKLRCIQSAIRETPPVAAAGRKRKLQVVLSPDDDDTDSEVDIMSTAKKVKKTKTKAAVVVEDEEEEQVEEKKAGLQLPTMKRNARILDPNNAHHAALIASASKVSNDYYDSDAEDLPGKEKDTTKPDLFRNVAWGDFATDYSNDADFSPSPAFSQFVPGRFELLEDGSVRDQKSKLVLKLLDKNGRKRIFANPPPRDWSSQEAITALNKRTVQQIRRNTAVRFREVVLPYVGEERAWILANLSSGKPTMGWKTFVDEFNKAFEGKMLVGVDGARPFRSHSSLTKEVERFGVDFYGKGLVPSGGKKVRKK
jgi:hypothetical protein